MLVLGWVVLEFTDSPWRVGLLGFFRMAPMPLLGLPAGLLADRIGRKRIMVFAEFANVLFAATLTVLAILDVARFWHIALISAGFGSTYVFIYTARNSLIQDLVGTDRLTNAISLDVVGFLGSKMLSPIVGGLLLDRAGFTGAMVAITALHVAALILLLPIRVSKRAAPVAHEPVIRMLREGMRYVLGSRVPLAAILITVVANLLMFPVHSMIPVFARDVLNVSATLMGVLVSVDGLGSLVGAMYVASRSKISRPGSLFAYGTTFMAVFTLFFALSKIYGISVLFLLLMGVGFSGFETMQPVLVLLGAPANMRGRALGVMMIAIGVIPIGILMTGAAAEAWGAPVAIAAELIVALVLLVAIMAVIPEIRRKQNIPNQDDE